MLNTKIILWLCFLLLATHQAAAQQPPSTTAAPQSQTASQTSPADDQFNFKSRRRRVSKPAEFQGAGVLQLDYGYNGDFRARQMQAAQAATLNLNFALTDSLLLEFSNDNLASQTDTANLRQTGIGNTSLGFQWTALEEKEQRPSLGFAYLATLPTGSQGKGFNNGRAMHKVTGLASKQVSKTDVDFNASLLLNGIEGQRSYDKGLQLALGFTRNLKRGFGLQWEIAGQTLDADEPKGAFALWTLTWQPNVRIQFDAGMRYGLTASAPRYGIFFGVNLAVTNLYPSRRR
ncbi:MAG: transporter [Blastocatellales bacterium]